MRGSQGSSPSPCRAPCPCGRTARSRPSARDARPARAWRRRSHRGSPAAPPRSRSVRLHALRDGEVGDEAAAVDGDEVGGQARHGVGMSVMRQPRLPRARRQGSLPAMQTDIRLSRPPHRPHLAARRAALVRRCPAAAAADRPPGIGRDEIAGGERSLWRYARRAALAAGRPDQHGRGLHAADRARASRGGTALLKCEWFMPTGASRTAAPR